MTTITPEARRLARQSRRHIIEEVRFSEAAMRGLPMDSAPLRCSCGAETTSGEWSAHRGDTAEMERVKRAHRAADERRRVA
jgi:hypothetical protein